MDIKKLIEQMELLSEEVHKNNIEGIGNKIRDDIYPKVCDMKNMIYDLYISLERNAMYLDYNEKNKKIQEDLISTISLFIQENWIERPYNAIKYLYETVKSYLSEVEARVQFEDHN